MSSKDTIKRGDNFHVYKDLWDEDTIYLNLDKADFECYSDGTITLSMPVALWEVIRTAQGHKFEYVNLSKQELMDKAVYEVEERIKDYNREDNPPEWLSFMKTLHPDLELDKDEQIKTVYDKFLMFQKEEKNLLKRIRKINDSSD